ncbi:MAG: PIN domain-containing protein [Verrucomicrobiota bacterium]|jgi:predicted nucleic acid-binding protein
MIYADTSFIASAYGLDANTASARHFIESNKPRLPLFFLHWPELAKSFWTSHPESAETLWDWVKEDMAGGKKLYPLELEADLVARRAAGLIINYCPRWKKLRSLDALHVAAAVTGNFKTFVSFDRRSFQRVLAVTQKLKVWPPLTAGENQSLK